MGNCCKKDVRTSRLDVFLKLEQKEAENKIKILLLGAGESGKTTLYKQMKLLYSDTKDFSGTEKEQFKRIIFKNICTDLQLLLKTVERRQLQLGSDEGLQAYKYIQTNRNKFNPRNCPKIDIQVRAVYEAVWNDPIVQQVWNSRDNVQVQESLKYYMSHLDRICNSNWLPSQQDILRARARTSGCVTSRFCINNTSFEMTDVGGQRTERKKWLKYFDSVTAVLFVAAISEFNQVLFEDSSMNRQQEAVELFHQQLHLKDFFNIPFILFLNKKDLFREKITKTPFVVDSGRTRRNEDFEGPHIDLEKDYNYEEEGVDSDFEICYVAAIQYLIKLYESQAPEKRGENGHIYCHPTNSTDSENIRKIMDSCKDIVLNEQFTGGGFF